MESLRMTSQANVCWGSPRIVDELRKLGIDVAESTVRSPPIHNGFCARPRSVTL
jgi:hypothetical protein